MAFLETILAPVLTTEFMESYWDKKHLRVEGNLDKFAKIFTLKSFTEILEKNELFLSYPQITIFQNGERVDEKLFSKKWSMRSSAVLGYQEKISIDLNKINALFKDGATLKISQINSLYPEIIEHANSFSDQINPELIYVNALFSTKFSQGYKPHFDEHDVFILQIHGMKTWEIFTLTQDNPLQEYRGMYSDEEYRMAHKETIILKQGDFLYVPRGVWHNVYSTSESSLHLQIGIRAKTAIDLIYWIKDILIQNSHFRKSLLSTQKIDNATKSLIIDSISRLLEDSKSLDQFFELSKSDLPRKARINI